MTWGYDVTALHEPLNEARLLIGDTAEATPLLQDEEILYLLAATGGHVREAAAQLCELLAAKFSAAGDLAVGDLRLSSLRQADHFHTRAATLRRASGGVPTRQEVCHDAVRGPWILERPWEAL